MDETATEATPTYLIFYLLTVWIISVIDSVLMGATFAIQKVQLI